MTNTNGSFRDVFVEAANDQAVYLDEYLLVVGFNLPVCVVGIIANLLVIVVMSKRAHRKYTINALLAILAVSDCGLLISSILFVVVPVVAERSNNLDVLMIYPHLVKLSYPVGMICQVFTVYMTILISVQRFFLICHPLKAHRYKNKLTSIIGCIAVLVFAVVETLPTWWDIEFVPMYDLKLKIIRSTPSMRIGSMFYQHVYKTACYTMVMFAVPFGVLIYTADRVRAALFDSKKLRSGDALSGGIVSQPPTSDANQHHPLIGMLSGKKKVLQPSGTASTTTTPQMVIVNQGATIPNQDQIAPDGRNHVIVTNDRTHVTVTNGQKHVTVTNGQKHVTVTSGQKHGHLPETAFITYPPCSPQQKVRIQTAPSGARTNYDSLSRVSSMSRSISLLHEDIAAARAHKEQQEYMLHKVSTSELELLHMKDLTPMAAIPRISAGNLSIRSRKISKLSQRDARITCMLMAVVYTFLACNTLPFLTNLVDLIVIEGFKRVSMRDHFFWRLMVDLGNLLVCVNSSSTIFIYMAFNVHFRRSMRAIFCGLPMRNLS